MSQKTATTGNHGEKVRSDCQVTLEITREGGRIINVESKVQSMYGKSNLELIHKILDHYEIDHCRLELLDSGALPPVIAARMEASVKQLLKTTKEFLPDLIPENQYASKRDAFRFSRLYLPGNTPAMMLNAGIHHPNGIILDLEDSVAPAKKKEAQLLVRNALRQVNFYGAERMVRINQVPAGIEDLQFVVPHNVHVILIPKCEQAEQVLMVEEEVKRLMLAHELHNEIYFMPIIESALGVENAFSIAASSEKVIALAMGLEDLTADLGVARTEAATESFYARTRVVNACKAARKQPIDSVYSDVANMEGLMQNVLQSKSLGFEGMGCIHPRQISVIHKGFAPTAEEIAKAADIAAAFREAEQKGLGVVSLGSKMIDPPVVKRALRIIEIAEKFGIIAKKID
ncbi:MAG TPA: aldolase/citrate lyase family protein [Bacteroidales bacterium]|nr:aldolase/citrate lyase family protein [Bacteroidales bacterium]